MNKTNGQIAYEAYCASTGWKSLVSGAQLPPWENVKGEIQTAWEAAGYQVAYGMIGESGVLRAANEALIAKEQEVRNEANALRRRVRELEKQVDRLESRLVDLTV